MTRRSIQKKLRHEILKRDGFRCCHCGRGSKDGVKLHIDHKIPVVLGGTNDPSNLQTLCQDCNLGKSDTHPDDSSYLKTGKSKRRRRKRHYQIEAPKTTAITKYEAPKYDNEWWQALQKRKAERLADEERQAVDIQRRKEEERLQREENLRRQGEEWRRQEEEKQRRQEEQWQEEEKMVNRGIAGYAALILFAIIFPMFGLWKTILTLLTSCVVLFVVMFCFVFYKQNAVRIKEFVSNNLPYILIGIVTALVLSVLTWLASVVF